MIVVLAFGHGRRAVDDGLGLLLVLPYLLLSLPFALDGSFPIGSASEYGQHWTHHASVHALLSLVVGSSAARGALWIVGALVFVGLLLRSESPARGYLMLFTAMLILSPVVHPWYGLWLLVFVPLWPRLELLVLVSLLPLSYLSWTSQAAGGEWAPPGWVPWLSYGLPLLVLLGTWSKVLPTLERMSEIESS